MTGKAIRLKKLFSNDQNAVIIAIDHGMFDGPIPGMADLKETVRRINPAVDGILLRPGMIKACQEAFSYKGAPLPIVRINWGSVYCFHWQYNRAATVVADGVEDAMTLASNEIRDGARGVVFGRNAIQVPVNLPSRQPCARSQRKGRHLPNL